MALITKGSNLRIDAASAQFAPQISGDLFAGEDLGALDLCYIKQADGLVYRSNGTAATEPASFDGVTPQAYLSGAAVTLYGPGTKMEYATGMTPGIRVYIGATAGRIDTAATTGDAVGIGETLTARVIQIRAYK
jgi:hypothetical protein